MVKTVGVVGAGPSGLTAVKWCMHENLVPTCFEKSDDIGGLWHYTGRSEDRVTVMACTVANLSKEISSFSDFPAPRDFPMYLPHPGMKEYLKMYGKKFDLEKHVRLNTEVLSVKETDDHDVTGQWHVTTKAKPSGEITTHVFDAVIVCSGVLGRPYIPDIPGLDTFSGRVLHARDYKDSRGFENTRVVVVGAGNSAGDAACDISSVASQVSLSARNGAWLLERRDRKGRPFDFNVTRANTWLLQMLPGRIINSAVAKQCNSRLDHTLYGLNPRCPPFRSTVLVNDDIPFRFMTGAVKMRPHVSKVKGSSVEFSDGSVAQDIDVIVFATGYKAEVRCLNDDVIPKDKSEMFMTMFPSDRKLPTLVVNGCFRNKGPIFPVVEMQARYAAKVLKGSLRLPDKAAMRKWIARNRKESLEQRIPGIKGVAQIDYVPFMDDLARLIGCKPKLGTLFLTDPQLAYKCVFEPCTSYQYRLHGPDPWPEARTAIMGQVERTFYPLTDGKCRDQVPERRSYRAVFITFSVILCAIAMVYKASV